MKRKRIRIPKVKSSCSGAPSRRTPGAQKLRNVIGIPNWLWRGKPHLRAILRIQRGPGPEPIRNPLRNPHGRGARKRRGELA